MVPAIVPADIATVGKAAAGELPVQRRHRAADGIERLLALAHIGQGIEQLAAVGMCGSGIEAVAPGLLDQLPGIHDGHAVGHVGDDAEIVGDQQDRHVHLLLQFLQQFQHLGLDGDIQCRGRFVGNQQIGLAGQRDRDHHALFHAAGQLVRVFVDAAPCIGDADRVQQFQHALARRASAHGEMLAKHLADLVADGQHRVQRGHRLLEDHGNPPAANPSHAGFRQRGEFVVAEPDMASGDAADGLRQQAQDRQRGHGLAAAGLAEQCEGLAAPDGQADTVDRADGIAAAAQLHRQVLDSQ